jgi:tetratricopeptide (TPR) repeat protein
LCEPTGIQLIVEIIAAELCADCALVGAWEEAHAYAMRTLIERTYAVARSTQLTLWHQAEALARVGEIARAAEDVRDYGERLGHSPRYRIPYLRAQAVLAQHRGEIAMAIEHLRAAAQLAEAIGVPGELWPILSHIGNLCQEQGNNQQAGAAFDRAAAIVQSLALSVEDAQRRATFLAAPQVRYLLERGSRSS